MEIRHSLFARTHLFSGAYLVSSAFASLVTVYVLIGLYLGGGSLTLLLGSVVFGCVLLAVRFGEGLLKLFGLNNIQTILPVSLIVGSAFFSGASLFLSIVFGWPASFSFALSALGLTISTEFLAYRFARPEVVKLNWNDFWIACLVAFAIMALAKTPFNAPVVLAKTGMLNIWNDYYIHGVTIASFGSEFSLGSDMELVGERRPLYHYFPFIPAAAILTLSNLTPLAAATSIVLPLGLLLGTLGCYAFACELGGRVAGLFTIAVLLSLPLASTFVNSGWFDPYWLTMITPGSGYGIALSMLAFLVLRRFLATQNLKLLLLLAILLGLLFFTRFHFFLLVMPTCSGAVAIHLFKLNNRLGYILLIGSLIVLSLLASIFKLTPETLIQISQPGTYLASALDGAQVFGHPVNLSYLPNGLRQFIALILILLASVGLSIIRLGFTNFEDELTRDKFIPKIAWLMLLTYVFLVIFAPENRVGDLSDYKHRHFSLLYFSFTLMACVSVTRYLKKMNFGGVSPQVIVCLISSILILGSLVVNWGNNPSRPKLETMTWAKDYHNQTIEPGVLSVAEFLKARSKPGDVIGLQTKLTGAQLNAVAVEIIALSGLPTYISRPLLKTKGSGCLNDLVASRQGSLEKLEMLANWADAEVLLQSLGIRWYVTMDDSNRKAFEGGIPAFRAGRFSVYDSRLQLRSHAVIQQC